MAINHVTRNDFHQFIQDPSLELYQKLSGQNATYPGKGTALGLIYAALKLGGEVGELQDHVGKAMRDDDLIGTNEEHFLDTYTFDELRGERKLLIIKELGDILWYWLRACEELQIEPLGAMAGNLRKIVERSERGTQQGSGDDR